MSYPRITVLSLNLHKGFTTFNTRLVLHELREAIRTAGADLVFLQEVVGENRLHSTRHERWPAVPQYEFLADTIWHAHAYGRNAVYPQGHHGNAILSKFPIAKMQNHDVSLGRHERRGLLYCEIEIPGQPHPLHAICVHLGLREVHRRQQLQRACSLVRDVVPPDHPLIIAGDFNDWRQRAHAIFSDCADLREIFIEQNGRPARTFPAIYPVLPLDRIYVRNLDIHTVQVLAHKPWSRLSDHAGLLGELDMKAA